MIIEKTKDGLKVTHPTGVVQVISKDELLSIIDEHNERILELQSEKDVMQIDIAEIDVLSAN